MIIVPKENNFQKLKLFVINRFRLTTKCERPGSHNLSFNFCVLIFLLEDFFSLISSSSQTTLLIMITTIIMMFVSISILFYLNVEF